MCTVVKLIHLVKCSCNKQYLYSYCQTVVRRVKFRYAIQNYAEIRHFNRIDAFLSLFIPFQSGYAFGSVHRLHLVIQNIKQDVKPQVTCEVRPCSFWDMGLLADRQRGKQTFSSQYVASLTWSKVMIGLLTCIIL